MATSLYKAQEALKTCNEHEHEELLYFCKTCNRFICTKCAKTIHNGHEWDLVSLVAKTRRKETPVLCRKIRKENMPWCREKLRLVDEKISFVGKAIDEDLKKLEERRTEMIKAVNQIIDEQKQKREEFGTNEMTNMKEQNRHLCTKIEYLDKMTSSLDNNIEAYNDYDVIEMEQEMLTALHEVFSCEVNFVAIAAKFVSGQINGGQLLEMIGTLDEMTITVQDSTSVEEVKTYNDFSDFISTIAPISRSEAWIGDGEANVKLLSIQTNETQSKALQQFNDFAVFNNGDFIVTDSDEQKIRLLSSAGKDSIIVSTKPLYPSCITKTPTDELLVSLRDDGDYYNLQESSSRLVQRMTRTGRVVRTFEFQDDGTTRMFTLPYRAEENGNSDICVINDTSNVTGELIVLHRNGRVRATYREHAGSILNISDVACDSMNMIIVADLRSRSLHLLGPDCAFLRRLLSDMFDYPQTMALHQDTLWVGFNDGTVKVYKYEYCE